MISNTHISLDRSSQIRMDALNTIKYTLMLDYKVPVFNSWDRLISDIMENCQKCCDGLFKEQNILQETFDFFGTPLPSGSSFPFYSLNTINSSPKSATIPSMILHHCILSSYHAVLTCLLQNQSVSSYTIANKIKAYGIQSLKKKGILSLEKDKILCKTGEGDMVSSKGSDFDKSVKTHRKIDFLSNAMNLITNEDPEDFSGCSYNLQFSELCYRICDKKAADWKKINKKSKLEAIRELTAYMEPHDTSFKKIETIHFKGNMTDALYHYYLTERIFNFGLFFSLLDNITQIENRTNYRLCQEHIISTLCLCKNLPNVFSRQVFLKYAFEPLESEPSSYEDFWHHNDTEKSKIVLEMAEHPRIFDFSRWTVQYKSFFKYMYKYATPVYEWCFINMLMESIEQVLSNESHYDHLLKALEVLDEYMGKNYSTIIHPFQVKGNVLDIITEHQNYILFESIPKDYINQIIQNILFSPDEHLELNMTPLNPAFFKYGDRDDIFKPTSKLIRNFYNSLVRSSYLQ